MIEALIGLAGVVVGSAITISKEVWTSWLTRRRDGSYAAIRLICILEKYADKCIAVVYDDGTAYGRPAGRTESGEEYRKVQASTPDPLDFPEEIDWRTMPEPLMHRILALPNKARSTDRHIEVLAKYADCSDYKEFFEPRQRGYAQFGLDALEIADDLRQHFQISVRSRAAINTDWDPMAFLREKTSVTKEAA